MLDRLGIQPIRETTCQGAVSGRCYGIPVSRLPLAVHIADITEDPEYSATPVVEVGFRTSLAVPMLRDGQPIGAISVSRMEPRPFTHISCRWRCPSTDGVSWAAFHCRAGTDRE
jgi:GAF domain-containing protein